MPVRFDIAPNGSRETGSRKLSITPADASPARLARPLARSAGPADRVDPAELPGARSSARSASGVIVGAMTAHLARLVLLVLALAACGGSSPKKPGVVVSDVTAPRLIDPIDFTGEAELTPASSRSIDEVARRC